jgi:hypothetical protein
MTSVATDDRSVEALRGRATGVLFLSGFGALWFLLGLAASQRLSLPTACALAAGLVALVAGTVLLRRRSAALPASRLDPEEQRQAGRTFGRVNAAQWAAIVLIAVVLGRLHLDAYTPAAVTVVVGLHFFPLARLFRSPQHHVTGAALVLWGAVCLLLVRGTCCSPRRRSEPEPSSGLRQRSPWRGRSASSGRSVSLASDPA